MTSQENVPRSPANDDGWPDRQQTELRNLMAEAAVAYDTWLRTPHEQTVAWRNSHHHDVVVSDEKGKPVRRINAKRAWDAGTDGTGRWIGYGGTDRPDSNRVDEFALVLLDHVDVRWTQSAAGGGDA